MASIICAECGQQFIHPNKNVLTCSDACRKARKRRQDIRCKSGIGRVGHIAKCGHCGKQFVITGTTQKFCSPKCRKRHEGKLRRQNMPTVDAVCIICGKEFLTSPNTRAKTCGKECGLQYKSALAKERSAKAKEENGTNQADCMPCPWASGKLDTLPPGIKTWDCPEMDPMGCGSARVALKMETKDAQRRAA